MLVSGSADVDLYVRVKATASTFASAGQGPLVLPMRRSEPDFSTIDYVDEVATTSDTGPFQYSTNAFTTVAGEFSGQEAAITPNTTYYFRFAPTASEFASEYYTLVVPARDAAPSFTVNYNNENTNENVSSSQEYKKSVDASWTSGGNVPLLLDADALYLIRGKASVSEFATAACSLDIPPRPDMTSIQVNWNTIQTTPVEAGITYSVNSNMSGANVATGASIPLTPGTDLYFEKAATASSFGSGIYHLNVPLEPVLSAITDISGTVTEYPIDFEITFEDPVTGFGLEDIFVDKALAENVSGSGDYYTFQLYPTALGTITLYLLANRVDEGNFTSNALSFNYNGDLPLGGLEKIGEAEFSLFPNPSSGVITLELSDAGVHHIQVLNSKGSLVYEKDQFEQEEILDLSEFVQGLYLIKVSNSNGISNVRKIILTD
jgi:hypothetical protein